MVELGWNYESEEISSTGYEELYDELRKYNRAKYLDLTDEGKEYVLNEILQIYRSKNIFPITYYNEDGILKEIQKCYGKEVKMENDLLNFPLNQGSSLCRFMFPNLAKVVCKGQKNNTPYEKFHNDEKLKKAIHFCLQYKKTKSPVLPSGIKDGIEMMGGNVATNFKVMNAKALFEEYTPEGGVIYDYAAGFGGRMLGAMSSKKNYTYIGVEPVRETIDNLKVLGDYIKLVNPKADYRLHCGGSEEKFTETKEFVDFAFSSPPYFNLEKYSDDKSQCYIKYPDIDSWFEGYVRPTIQNIYGVLRPGCYYAVNISDFKLGTKMIKLVDKWTDISKEIGFEFDKQIFMSLQSRRGTGHDKDNKRSKKEGIFVFRKNI